MEKENKRLKGLLCTLSVLAMGLCGYFVYTVYSINSENKCRNLDSKVYRVLSEDELSKIDMSDFNITTLESGLNHSYGLDISGKVVVDFNNYLSNISDVKDIKLFDNILYILTNSGDVYKYNTDSSSFIADKVNEYSNIERMILYRTRRLNAGGCDYIVFIDRDNIYHELSLYCA